MSGKKTKKRANKKRPILTAAALCAVVLAGLILILARKEQDEGSHDSTQETILNQSTELIQAETTITAQEETALTADAETTATADAETTAPADAETPSVEAKPQDVFDLGSDVKITGFISYTGAFMEDRTDEVVTDVLAIKVTNSGEEYIQTMDITLSAGDTQAQFSLSTLFPGETVVVLEKNRMAYSTAPEFEKAETSAVALFDGHPGMCEDKLDIQCLNGVINVTNISNEDISGDILIYYKNYVSGVYYGGITYRIRIEGGLKAGGIHQGTAAHFNPDNSTVVFVTCG